jgi:transcription factor SOX1/3/14/21 (SOX group B)/transcription factor SOX9 (SOX group E)
MSRLDSLIQHSQANSDAATYRRSDRSSPRAESDDGTSYNHRRPSVKADEMAPEDTQLTSQALNSDGTPRRPMNAFMIFARRRRPQVSAANQTMRTGDISKILSKEWNSMDMGDKQFYLDQAKRLKETFNSKYPDYVYRRRPNNSRRKRRPDANTNPLFDPSTAGDAGDDFPATHDFDYPSVDVQEPARELAPSRSSSNSGMTSGFSDNSSVASPHATLSTYGYPTNDYPTSHIPPSGPRLPHLSSLHVHDHLPPSSSETPSLSSLPSHHYPDTSMHSHAYTSSHASQPPPTSAQSSSTSGPDRIAGSSVWGSVRGDHGRAIQPTWSTAPPVIPPLSAGNQLRERAAAPPIHTKGEVYSDPSPCAWSTPTSQPSPAISSASSHVSSRSSNGYPLQTLSSPFFPPSHSPGAYQSSASSSSTPSGSPENYYSSSSQLQGSSYGGRAGGGYEQATIYNSHPVPQPQSRSSRPSLHSALDSGMPPLNPPSSGSAAYTSSSMDHWRAKIGGQQ